MIRSRARSQLQRDEEQSLLLLLLLLCLSVATESSFGLVFIPLKSTLVTPFDCPVFFSCQTHGNRGIIFQNKEGTNTSLENCCTQNAIETSCNQTFAENGTLTCVNPFTKENSSKSIRVLGRINEVSNITLENGQCVSWISPQPAELNHGYKYTISFSNGTETSFTTYETKYCSGDIGDLFNVSVIASAICGNASSSKAVIWNNTPQHPIQQFNITTSKNNEFCVQSMHIEGYVCTVKIMNTSFNQQLNETESEECFSLPSELPDDQYTYCISCNSEDYCIEKGLVNITNDENRFSSGTTSDSNRMNLTATLLLLILVHYWVWL